MANFSYRNHHLYGKNFVHHRPPARDLVDVTKLPAGVKTLKNLTLHEPKAGGVSSGGVYKDIYDHKWMIKEPQWGAVQNGVKEFVAGAIYQRLMGGYAPQTELYINQKDGKLQVGSKYLQDFSTLSSWAPYKGYSKPDHMPTTYQGKPIINMENMLTSIIFMGDSDAHKGNVGVVEENNAWVLSKIDHGFAFVRSGDCDLGSFKSQAGYYGNFPLKEVSYDNLYKSIKMVVDMSYKELKGIVEAKCGEAQKVIDAANQFNPVGFNSMPILKDSILKHISNRQKDFAKILDDLEIDNVLHNNDTQGLQDLIDKGINLNKPIQSFYEDQHDLFYKAKTPLELAKEYHANDVVAVLQTQQPQPIVQDTWADHKYFHNNAELFVHGKDFIEMI